MYIRTMIRNDIHQVTMIDREVFPTEWPPTNFSKELDNKLAYYLVAFKVKPQLTLDEISRRNEAKGFYQKIKNVIGGSEDGSQIRYPDKIIGYGGVWVMADETHIVDIASRPEHRRQGIGEALLFGILDIARCCNSRVATLEVRVSNLAAQAIYTKFGFNEVGFRKGYYLDNREDALIMTTDYIGSGAFEAHIKKLRAEHSIKWGRTEYDIEVLKKG